MLLFEPPKQKKIVSKFSDNTHMDLRLYTYEKLYTKTENNINKSKILYLITEKYKSLNRENIWPS
jgi:hypothetical protein